MKKIFLLIFFLLLKQLGAQNLEPNNSIFEIADYQFEYYSKIRNKLYKNLADKPEIRLIVKPSFSAEYIFQIEKSENEYLAKVNVMSESIWYSDDYNSIQVNEYVSSIDEEDVKLLWRVYLKCIEKVHYPIKESFGLDGVNYNLSVWDYGFKSGLIWSPSDSLNKTILDVTNHLIEDVKKGKNKVSLSKKNERELNKIFKELNANPSIDNYKLILNAKDIIETNKEKYLSKLSENHKDIFNQLIQEFERKMILEFSFNKIELDFMENLINQCIKKFNHYIEFETYKEDTNDIESYKSANIADNIFLKLKSEFK